MRGDDLSWIECEESFAGCEISHLQSPFTRTIDASLPLDKRAQRLALCYLETIGSRLGLAEEHLRHLAGSLDDHRASLAPGFQIRWAGSRSIRDGESVALWLQQTHVVRDFVTSHTPLDVWEAGIRIVVHTDPLRIVAASSTLRPRLEPKVRFGFVAAPAEPIAPTKGELEAVLLRLLGRPPGSLRNADFRSAIYRVDERARREALDGEAVSLPAIQGASTSVEAPARIEPGTEIAVIVARFTAVSHDGSSKTVQALFDRECIYRLRTLSAAVSGGVFLRDPMSAAGLSAAKPSAQSAALDAHQAPVNLLGLFPPQNGRQALEGEFVQVRSGLKDSTPPSEKVGAPFRYSSRTERFAAVNAYHHCDAKFRLVQAFGFPLHEVFPKNFGSPDQRSRGVRIWSLAAIRPGCHAGRCINAQVDQAPGEYEVGQIRFALADLSDPQRPLGLATDDRFVWHEFCHALLVGATDSLELGFAHSAGDAMAAIAADPESALATDPGWRGITYPWIRGLGRRHDRRPEDGWGWFGQMHDPAAYPPATDPAGYRSEQILSSTLFRLYRSVGGDAEIEAGTPDRVRRRLASDYVIYLIIRAIAGLATNVVPARTAQCFATRLMEADIGTRVFEHNGLRRHGGTLYKVIRWAFEKQGLYQPAAAPWPRNREGDPPECDVFIDDAGGRKGEYLPVTKGWHASPGSLWIRNEPDGGEEDEAPNPGIDNYVYVRVSNRGSREASTRVSVFASRDDVSTWSTDGWALLPAQTAGAEVISEVPSLEIPPGASRVFGPFRWTAPPHGSAALLASASAPGDLANIDVPDLACRSEAVPIGDLVPFDNNLGFRSFVIA